MVVRMALELQTTMFVASTYVGFDNRIIRGLYPKCPGCTVTPQTLALMCCQNIVEAGSKKGMIEWKDIGHTQFGTIYARA